jgi:quinol monooxygenase YgiN
LKETIGFAGGAFMMHILVRHKVSDYNRWKDAFDSHLTTRKRAGETGFRLFHNVEDPHEVILLLDWESTELARKFMGSDELRSAMEKAGVVGAPEIQYLEDVRSVHRTSAD